MNNEKNQGIKKQKPKFIKSTFGVGLLCIAAATVMIIRGIGVQPDIARNKEAIAELNVLIAEEKSRQEEVDRMRANSNTDEYAEKVARDSLGMVKSDEIVFYDVAEK